MKQKKLLLSLLALTVLASCGETIGGLKKGEDVLNGAVIDNNFEEEKVEEKVNTLVQSKVGEITLDQTEVLNEYSNGVIATINSEGYVGFYSTLYQKQIIANQYESEWVKYSVETNSDMGGFIYVTYEGTKTIYDVLGNVIFSGNERDYTYVDTEVHNETVYLTFGHGEYDSSITEYTYYKYLSNGQIREITDITDDVLQNLPVDDEENEFPFGSQYNEITSLEEFGLEGYISISGRIFTLYNSSKEIIKTYHLPENTEGFAVITNKLYYQVFTELPEDSKNYDVYLPSETSYDNAGKKYRLETYSINLEDGKESQEKLDFFIQGSRPYKGETDGQNYSVLYMQLITKDKVLGEEVAYIIDKEGVLHDRVDGISLEYFEKVGNNYLNERTGILYDSSFKEIAYIGNINPSYDKESGYITGYKNGHYGILTSDAEVALEFTADQIVSKIVNDKVITYRNGVYYRNDLNTGHEEVLGVYLQSLGNGAYATYDHDNYYFHNAAGVLYTVPRENLYNFNYEFVQLSLNNVGYLVVKTTYREEVEVYDEDLQEYVTEYVFKNNYATIDINRLPNSSTIQTVGSERYDEIVYNISEETAATLQLGSGIVHGDEQVVSYYAFTPVATGYYTFSVDSVYSFSAYGDTGSLSVNRYYNSVTEMYENTVGLYADETYYFVLSSSYSSQLPYTAYPYVFELEKGDEMDYPLIYTSENNVLRTNDYGEAYFVFTPEYDGRYTIDIEDGSIAINGTYYDDGEYVYLKAGQMIAGTYFSSYYDVADKTINLLLDANKQAPAMSLFNASSISTNSSYPTNVTYTNEYGNYYKFKNNSSSDQIVVLNGTATSNYTTTYNVYNNELEMVDSGTTTFYNDGKIYAIVKPYETVYFELVASNSYNASIYAEYLNVSVSDIVNDKSYSAYTTKVFKEEVYSSSNLVSISYQSSYSAQAIILNKNGRVIDILTGTSDSTGTFLIDGSETFYFYVPGLSNNNVSFNIQNITATTLYLYQSGDTLYTQSISSYTDKYYMYTNTTEETQYVRVRTDQSSISGTCYVTFISQTGSTSRYRMYSYDYEYMYYYVDPGESVWVLIENESSYTNQFTLKVEEY